MEELEGRHVRLWVAEGGRWVARVTRVRWVSRVTRGRWVSRDVRMRGSVEM